MSSEVEYRGQCEAWWDAYTCQQVDWPKSLTRAATSPIRSITRCVMEAGHEPVAETAAAGGHNFDGLGPYTPGMPGWKAQQRALGLSDVIVPTCVKWAGHDFPNGITCRNCWAYWNEQRNALFAADPQSWTPPNDLPMCVKWERHSPNGTTCNHCWPYWHAVAERSAPREQCPDVHAHEPHGWSGFDPGAPLTSKWCVGVEQCPPSAADRVALTMTPDAGQAFLKALNYAANRLWAREVRTDQADMSHEDWLRWGASRLDAALRAVEPAEEGQER
jgi:hypothetical protein